MGVSCILVWKETHGVGSQRVLEAITAGIDGLKSATKSRWTSAVTLLRAAQEATESGAENALLVSPSESSTFLYIVRRRSKQVLEAEAPIASLVLQSGTHRARARVMLEGVQQQVGDFLVRTANLAGSGEHRGTFVQVQYRPTNSMAAGVLAQEFAAVIAATTATSTGRLHLIEQPFLGWSLPAEFCEQHTAVLLCAAIANLVKW